MATENKTIVRRFIEEGVNMGDAAVIDQYVAAESLKQHIQQLRAAFPDFRFTIKEQLANATGNVVVARLKGHGTHCGAYAGILPTGTEVTVPGLVIYWLADGKIVDHMSQADTLGLVDKIEALAAPAHACA